MHKRIKTHLSAWLTFILLAYSLTTQALEPSGSDELLPPDEAYPIEAGQIDEDQIKVRWRIQDGYYLYRDKIKFETSTPGVSLNDPDLPEAKIKHDEFFGDVAIYRGVVEVKIPYDKSEPGPVSLQLTARSQGCADIGVCFPPHSQQINVDLPGGTTSSGQPKQGNLLSALTSIDASGGEDELLDPEDAYRVSAEVADGVSLNFIWEIARGTYLYQDKVTFELIDGEGIQLGTAQMPEPDIKQNSVKPDGSIGDVAVYHDQLKVVVPLSRSTIDPISINVKTRYQGCAEIGVCYPPQEKTFRLNLPGISTANAAASTNAASLPAQAATPVSEVDDLANTLAESSTFLVIGIFFLLGLGLAFTPCIFPMIPILSGIIAGQGADITTRKAFILSLVYVLAMALTYTAAGVLAGLFGGNLQASFQDPIILSVFALVFVLLALSMFGFYELQLPSSLQSKLTEISNRQSGGTLIGVGIMGFLSALIVGPCVAPPLAGALIYIGQTGDAVIGGLALFALSMGMGAPLLIIGASAGSLLPRAGAWMDTIKAVFGVALLGVAILMLERFIPADIAMLLWGLLLVISAIYLGALSQLDATASGWKKLWKGLGVALLIYGALMLVGAAAGGKDTLQPLRGLAMGGAGVGQGAHELQFTRIKSLDDLNQHITQAANNNQTVMLDFYADWCVSCKEMEKYTFSDPAVIAVLADTKLLQADVTANDEIDQALLQGHFGLFGPPAIMFYDKQGNELRPFRVVGFKPADEFVAHINAAF